MRIALTSRKRFRCSCPRPEVDLRIVTTTGRTDDHRFVIDSGSDFTQISVPWAEVLGIPFKRDRRIPVRTFKGHSHGWLSLVTIDVFGRPYTWPCVFAEAEEKDDLPSVIGRAGFLDDFTFILEREYFALVPRRADLFSRIWHRFMFLPA